MQMNTVHHNMNTFYKTPNVHKISMMITFDYHLDNITTSHQPILKSYSTNQ
jgi:hypothetical protein